MTPPPLPPTKVACAAHSRYTVGCAPCRDQGARYERHRSYDAQQGRPRKVDATGTRRRLQGLARDAWGLDDLAPWLGLPFQAVSRLRSSTVVHRDTAAAVTALYDRLAGTQGPSPRARMHATRQSWPPALAWDDPDDPHETPDPGWSPRPVNSGGDQLVDDIAWLTDAGATWPDLEARLHATREALLKALRRHHRPDLRARIDTHTYGQPQATHETRRAAA